MFQLCISVNTVFIPVSLNEPLSLTRVKINILHTFTQVNLTYNPHTFSRTCLSVTSYDVSVHFLLLVVSHMLRGRLEAFHTLQSPPVTVMLRFRINGRAL
jgi:hypothetical protein